MVSFVRISALTWADMFAGFAMYLMTNYLTDVWNLSVIHAAGIINIWDGITQALPFVFACFVDAFMGDYYMLVVSSLAYAIGLWFLFMSTPPILGPCSDYKEECIGHTQKVLFFTALSLIAVGKAGVEVSLKPFIKEQKKKKITIEEEKKEEKKRSCQAAGFCLMLILVLPGAIALPLIKKSWSARFMISCIYTMIASLLFLTGWRVYKRGNPEGSPLTTSLRVFVAAARKISQPFPNPTQLYQEDDAPSTTSLRYLDKAAIMLPGEHHQSKNWMLCSVREVEDTKIHIRMVPMWLTFIVIGIVLSIGNTYFLEQANGLNRKLGRIKVPIEIFLVIYQFSSSAAELKFNKAKEEAIKKKHAPVVGIAATMIYCVLCCITAAKVETRRLHVIRDHGLLEKPDETIPMTIFWLFPQYVLLGFIDGMANASISCFFDQQTPKSMHKYLTHLTKGVLGLGTMASVLAVYIVGKVSERNQKTNWFQPTMNESRFNRYYWVLAALSAVNLLLYLVVSCFYKYKEPAKDDLQAEGGEISEDVEDSWE
ncbi:hypothetical protein L2E82_31134 [Cichorium intybus]|uniref:Uncharacterized protein n=1 Tax=Cichorium intybus TaxID=13427 RepID=A0ACB9D251_CICIN|nr:hypothetical protein L2E82_31134 [Cichorium intybus]